jgi:hypothetical protein
LVKKILKKISILRELVFSKKMYLHGEKEDFEEYSPNLAFVELTSPILVDYLASKR